MLAQVMCCSLAWASTCIACGGAVVQCWVHCNLQWICLCPFSCQIPKSVAFCLVCESAAAARGHASQQLAWRPLSPHTRSCCG